MKKILGILTLLALASSTSHASASSYNRVLITDISIDVGTSVARVSVSGGRSGAPPACHNNGYPSHFAFDIATSKGKAMLSMLQSAQLAGKKVTLAGSATAAPCTTLGGTTTSTGAAQNGVETLTVLTVWTS